MEGEGEHIVARQPAADLGLRCRRGYGVVSQEQGQTDHRQRLRGSPHHHMGGTPAERVRHRATRRLHAALDFGATSPDVVLLTDGVALTGADRLEDNGDKMHSMAYEIDHRRSPGDRRCAHTPSRCGESCKRDRGTG